MSSRAWVLFGAVSLLWGTPYLFIKIALDGGLSPAFIAWGRTLLGAAVLLPLAWRAGVLSPVRAHGRGVAAFSLVEMPYLRCCSGTGRNTFPRRSLRS